MFFCILFWQYLFIHVQKYFNFIWSINLVDFVYVNFVSIFGGDFLAGLLMSLVPAICIAMGLLGYLDPEPLRIKLQELGVLDHFFVFVLALSLLNSALEELFFRCFLFERQQFFSKNGPTFITD